MMGPTKLSTIREDLRKAFKMSDAELLGWFNRQVERQAKEPKASGDVLHTLELFRDALVKEVKRGSPKRKPTRPRVRAKAAK